MNDRGVVGVAETLRVRMNLLYRWRRSFEEQGVKVAGKENFAHHARSPRKYAGAINSVCNQTFQ